MGLLPSASVFPCVDCAAPAVDYEHRDYNRPLAVEPVCRRCNLARGAAVPLDIAAWFRRARAAAARGVIPIRMYRIRRPYWFETKKGGRRG